MITPVLLIGLAAGPTHVVVYPDRAHVSRTATGACDGQTQIVFEHIPAAAASESFRAEAESGTVEGLRVEKISLAAELSEAVTAVRAKAEALAMRARELRDEQARAQASLGMGGSLDEVAGHFVRREMSSDKPDHKAWVSAYEQSTAVRLAADAANAKAALALSRLAIEQAEVNEELRRMGSGAQRWVWRAEVLVSCAQVSTARVRLTYLVAGASWEPSYQARLGADGAVELSLWASVKQSTGEPWDGVQLTLSTAVPSQQATPPELNRLYVRAQERTQDKKVLVARSEVIERAQSGSQAQQSGEGLATKDQGLSVQMAVPRKTKVSGDGLPSKVFVGQSKLRGSVDLRVTPKALPAAFRVAQLTNTAPWPLLPGMVEAYRGSGFVGRYSLDRVPQGGAFSLTFGLEESIRVRRTVLSEVMRVEGLFNDRQRFMYVYEMEVANYAKSATEIVLVDQVPVAEVNDIAIKVMPETTSGYTVSPSDGIVSWSLRLGVAEKKRVTLAFAVDVPSSYDTSRLQ